MGDKKSIAECRAKFRRDSREKCARLWRELSDHPIREWVTQNEHPDPPYEEPVVGRMTASVLRIIGILLGSIARMRSPWLWLLVEWLGWAVRRMVELLGFMADQVELSEPSAWRVRRMLTAPPQHWAKP